MLSQSALITPLLFEECDKAYMRPGDLDRCIISCRRKRVQRDRKRGKSHNNLSRE